MLPSSPEFKHFGLSAKFPILKLELFVRVCEQIVVGQDAWCCVYLSNQNVVVKCALCSLMYLVIAAVVGQVDSSAAGNT